jgi:hypothetical protein
VNTNSEIMIEQRNIGRVKLVYIVVAVLQPDVNSLNLGNICIQHLKIMVVRVSRAIIMVQAKLVWKVMVGRNDLTNEW